MSSVSELQTGFAPSPAAALVRDDAALLAQMQALYAGQLALEPGNAYLLEHGAPGSIADQIRTFHWYRPHLPASGAILDWGCNHAPDACMLRAWYGAQHELYSCDFVAADRYRVFHDFARTTHRQLAADAPLPFDDNQFDVVIGSGVLEHTAMDYEALRQLYRVLRPDGVLVISHLPNWLSYAEWRQREIRKRDFHRRLYRMSEASQLLKHSGFYPVEAGYHTFFWKKLLARAGLGRLERAPALLARLLPLQVFSSTLQFIARKVTAM